MNLSHTKGKLLALTIYASLLALFYLLKIPCLFQYFFRIPCPGCGMTRALLSLLRLDLNSAFHYHPMVWSLPFLGVYLLKNGGLFQNPKTSRFFWVFVGAGFFFVWIVRLLQFFG